VKKLNPVFKKLKNPKIFIPLIVVVVIVVIVAGFFIYQKNQSIKNNSVAGTQAEISDLVVRVGKLIELPAGETPTVATVSDKTKLAGQQFFARAENGDKVLVYAQGKKAFLYRPSQNKLIEVAFYNPPAANNVTPGASISPTTSTTVTTTPTPKPVTVVVYNGTKTAGLAKTAGDNLTSKFPNINVINTANATGDFAKTLVIDVSGTNKALAQSLATQLKGEVGNLPDSEVKPDSDILVIIGKGQ
jgi:hypothetical protein